MPWKLDSISAVTRDIKLKYFDIWKGSNGQNAVFSSICVVTGRVFWRTVFASHRQYWWPTLFVFILALSAAGRICSPLLHFCIFTVYLSKALLCTNIVHNLILATHFKCSGCFHTVSQAPACCMRLSIILPNQTIKATPTTPAPSLVWFSYLYRLDKGTLTSTDIYCISESWMCVSTYQTNAIHWQCLDWMPCSSYIQFCCASFIYCN